MAKYYPMRTQGLYVNFHDALVDYYGAGVTIYAHTTTYVVFTIPGVTDKVIRLMSYQFDYGTAYVSGSTISDAVQWLNANYYPQNPTVDLVLGDTFFAFCATPATQHRFVGVACRLSSGEYAVMSFVSYSGYGCHSYNTTTGGTLGHMSLTRAFRSVDSKVYKTPFLLVDRDTQVLYVDVGGAPTQPVGVRYVSYPAPSEFVVGDSFIITPATPARTMYTAPDSDFVMRMPLLFEFSSRAEGWEYRT